jgi:hypothetical protein
MDTPELTPILTVHCPVKASTCRFGQTGGGAKIVTVALTPIILTNWVQAGPELRYKLCFFILYFCK